MQMMDIAHQSLPTNLSFTARIVLGIAVAVGSVFLADRIYYWADLSYEMVAVCLVLIGVIVGYILKKHFVWTLLIPILVYSAYILYFIQEYEPYTAVGLFWAILIYVGSPLYLGAFFGYLRSRRDSARRARTQ